MERETGIEPATSTLARSHSTAELLPRVLSFYSTCAFRSNSLHPHGHPFLVRLLLFGDCTPVRQESLKELGLGVSCLVTVMQVVHRHVDVRPTKHALHHQWVVSVFDQEGREPMPQVVKPESRAILRNDSGSHRRRSDVVLHDHTAESRLFPMQLGRREHE